MTGVCGTFDYVSRAIRLFADHYVEDHVVCVLHAH